MKAGFIDPYIRKFLKKIKLDENLTEKELVA